MVYIPPFDIDPSQNGDTVYDGITKNDGNVKRAYEHLNELSALIGALPLTGQDILDALAPVDGIGSGLDAEYLGGKANTEYSLTSHIHNLATIYESGFMSTVDKQKLNNIPNGAEVNVQSDWNQHSSSHDGFIRNKPKIVGTTGLPVSGDTAVFTNATTVQGHSPDEMKTLLKFFQTTDFIESSAGGADAGKPVILDAGGLIHPTMIPAVPAQAVWGAITGTLSNQTDLQDALDLKENAGACLKLDGSGTMAGDIQLGGFSVAGIANGVNAQDAVAKSQLDTKESVLGNPSTDGYVLSSTAAGARSWVPQSGGVGPVNWGEIGGTLSNQYDLQGELDAKEVFLGNPTTDGFILSSTVAGARSWIPAGSGGGTVDWGAIGGTLSNQTDLQAELDTLTTGLADRYLKTEHIAVSVGVGDAGKPILLNSAGQVDSSMIDVSVFYYVGSFTPVAGTEYPDTTGESHGAFWVVQGVDAGTGYTFAGGDLTGLTVNNGDFMVWAAAGWSIMAGEMNPILYYRLDGSQPLTDHFRAGTFQLKDIANGSESQDAVSFSQLETKLDLAGGTLTGQLIITDSGGVVRLESPDHGYIYGVDNTGGDGWYFGRGAPGDNGVTCANYNGSSFDLPAGGGLTLDGNEVYHAGNLDISTKEDNLGLPANNGEILSSTVAGVRSWVPLPSGGSVNWGDIGGVLANQADLQIELDAKEFSLGNPAADGYVLSSTTTGSRSWIPAATGGGAVWGSITGTLSSQTDLQLALDAKAALSHTHFMSEISDLVFPVQSVNFKTGAVILTAADIGALDVNGTAYNSNMLGGLPGSSYFPATGGVLSGTLYVSPPSGTSQLFIDSLSGQWLNFSEGTVAKFAIGRMASGSLEIGQYEGNTPVNNFMVFQPSAGITPVMTAHAAGYWTINNSQIYTDAYHPFADNLLTEINQLKQRIAALEEA